MTPINGDGHTHVYQNGTVKNLVARFAAPVVESRLPPHNVEAERAVIGSVLIDPEAFDRIDRIVVAGDFYRDSHQLVFKTMKEMRRDGKQIDVVTLEAELLLRGRLDKAGGIEALMGFVSATPYSTNVSEYAGIVKQYAGKREMISGAMKVLNAGYAADTTLEDVAELFAGEFESSRKLLFGDEDSLDDVDAATAVEIRKHVSDVRWLWPNWIVASHMTVLAAEPAAGKTRLALDLCRRMWHCLPWPDGCMATVPMHTPTLWVSSDQVHGEMIHAMEAFGLPDESVYFNAPASDPFGGLKLDDPAEIRALRRRIKKYRPGMVVIDTVNKATRKALYRPEDAEAFFGPIIGVARDLQVPILAITHLSKSGDAMDRRIHGTCRVMMKLAKPEGDETTTRRRLWVAEIREGRAPAALGVQMGDEGNEYNNSPPSLSAPAASFAGSGGAGGKKIPAAVRAAMEWLRERLADGPIYCRAAIADAIEAGHGKTTLFKARCELGVITEGPKGNRFYRLPQPGETVDPDDEGEGDEEGEE